MKREIEITNGNTIKKALTFTLEDSFFSNRHFLADIYSPCTNPLCTCGELGFLIFEQSKHSNESEQTPVFKFTIDTEKRKLASKIRKDDIELKKFTSAFIQELKEENWIEFAALHHTIKTWLTKNIKDPMSLEVDFSQIDIAEGELLPYSEVFPFAEIVDFTVDGEAFAAFDYYCFSPKCRCTQVMIAFQSVVTTTGQEKPLYAAIFDYKKNKWSSYEQNPSLPKADRKKFIAAWTSAFPSYAAELKKRHKILKNLYISYLERTKPRSNNSSSFTYGEAPIPAATPVITGKKPGRNDPCPCGSGKKYKRCCGA